MITAVDSSVLLDVIAANPKYFDSSRLALIGALAEGSLLICPVVWAEVRAHFDRSGPLEDALTEAEIQFDVFDREVSNVAGAAWRDYRERGGRRTRVLPDFLVGAHAKVRADRLLTRDRGFYRRYFQRLTVIEP